MASLPRVIQNQIAAAEALLTEAYPPAETVKTQPEPERQAELPQGTDTDSVERTQEPSPAPVPAQAKDDWHQKYQILQGKYNAEVPQLHHQVKDLNRKLAETADRMEQLSRTQETKQKETLPQSVDPKDVENFGADLVDMVNRIAERRFGSVASQVEAKFTELQKMLGTVEQRLEGTSQTVAVTAEQGFFDKLTKEVPEWETINANPAFLAWLADSDPVYGVPRQRALDSAREQLDVARIVSVFRAFAPATTVAPVVRNPVDRQVSPKAGAANATQSAAPKAGYSQKQISDFYNDLARGKFRGREAEAAAIEQSVNLAIAEGRVR